MTSVTFWLAIISQTSDGTLPETIVAFRSTALSEDIFALPKRNMRKISCVKHGADSRLFTYNSVGMVPDTLVP
jgi:hypothetical protein